MFGFRRAFVIKRNPSADKPITKSARQPIKRPTKKPAQQLVSKSAIHAVNKSARDAVIRELKPRLVELAQSMGYALVDVVFVNEPHGSVLRATIDRTDSQDGLVGSIGSVGMNAVSHGASAKTQGSRVTLTDCEAFHRALIPLVESIDYDTLEVESPGADRAFQSDTDWAKAIDTDVDINLYKAERSAKHWHGRLVSVSADTVEIDTPKGRIALPRRSIAIARPWISLDSLDAVDSLDLLNMLDSEKYTQDNDADRRH
ncbi:hypothetical protein FACS1894184_07600 [Clostridia bacterium]|nr:hypothetical protein FACS1894184_07600 [Clostridia bacterium]